MVEKQVRVKLKDGLHARPAAQFVNLLGKFQSDVFLIKNDRKIAAKSIFNIMSAAVREGDLITVVADGDDEKEALDFVVKFLQEQNG
jgi:phosphotransferase system HPr (HPr) family protein